MIVHLFAEKYGWKINEILDLTKKQIRVMLESDIKLSEIRKETSPKIGKKTVNVDDPLMLFNFPGVKLSEKARKALIKKAGIKKEIKH